MSSADVVRELLAEQAALRAQLDEAQEAKRKAEWNIMNLGLELARKACVQCAGRIDPEKLRCLECDERDAELEARAEQAEQDNIRLIAALERVCWTFERDEAQGYSSLDRQFAITMLRAAMTSPSPATGEPTRETP